MKVGGILLCAVACCNALPLMNLMGIGGLVERLYDGGDLNLRADWLTIEDHTWGLSGLSKLAEGFDFIHWVARNEKLSVSASAEASVNHQQPFNSSGQSTKDAVQLEEHDAAKDVPGDIAQVAVHDNDSVSDEKIPKKSKYSKKKGKKTKNAAAKARRRQAKRERKQQAAIRKMSGEL